VPLQVEQVLRLSVSRKPCLHFGVVADVEGNVDTRAVFWVYLVAVEAICRVHILVKDACLISSLGFVDINTTLGKHVLEVKAANVDSPARRCVVEHGLRFGKGLPVAQDGSLAERVGNQVFPHDDDCDTGWAQVFRSTSVDNADLAPLDALGGDVR